MFPSFACYSLRVVDVDLLYTFRRYSSVKKLAPSMLSLNVSCSFRLFFSIHRAHDFSTARTAANTEYTTETREELLYNKEKLLGTSAAMHLLSC